MTGAALAYLPLPASPRPAPSRPHTCHARYNPFSRQPRVQPKPHQGVKKLSAQNAPGQTLKTRANPTGITLVAAETMVGCSVAAERVAPKAWSLGDDVYALTAKGSDPAWSTVRGRFWKNEAANPQYGTWDVDQLAAMRRGNAPQRFNIDKGGMESMDLSHEPIPFRSGGKDVVPRWPQDHALVDPYRRPGY